MKAMVRVILPRDVTLDDLRDELTNQWPAYKDSPLQFAVSSAGTLTITMSHDL